MKDRRKKPGAPAGKAADGSSDGKTAAPAPAEWPRRYTWITLAIILAASLAIGFVAVAQFRESPFFNLPIIDEEAYVEWADQIAGGDVIGHTIFYQDPLYPYFLALLFTVFGKSLAAARLVQVALGTASIAVLFFTARRLFGDRPALLAAGLMAGYRGLYFFEILLLKATLVIFFSTVSCALGVAAVSKPEARWRWVATGVSLGLLTLLRGNFQALIPFVLLWAFFFERGAPVSARLIRSLFLAAGIGLIITPVTIRNWKAAGEFVLTTSQGGANFFIGNNEAANGRYVTLPYVRANPRWESMDFKQEAEKRAGRELSPSRVSGFWFHEAFKWIEANPGKALRLLMHKARLMIHQHEIPDNHSFYLTRNVFVSVLWLPVFGFGILWGPALIGLWVLLRKDMKASYPALFAVLYSLSIIPFFIVARYRLAVAPALCMFSAAFVFWFSEKWRAGDMEAVVISCSVLLLSFMLGLYPTDVSRAPMGIEYYLLGNGYLKTGHPEAAIPWYDKALKTLPANQDLINNRTEAMRRAGAAGVPSIILQAGRPDTSAADLLELGKQAEQAGQVRLAIEIYLKAAAKDPNLFPARARLGYLYTTRPEVKDFAKAREHLTRALEINPDSIDTMNALGNCSFMAGDTIEARRCWEQVIKRDPHNQAAQTNLDLLGNKPPPEP